jgi:aerobic-type carbon monoxide dehydrogenase small subunit (CoxS/CutS family)
MRRTRNRTFLSSLTGRTFSFLHHFPAHRTGLLSLSPFGTSPLRLLAGLALTRINGREAETVLAAGNQYCASFSCLHQRTNRKPAIVSPNPLQHFSFLVNGARYDVLAPPLMSLGEVLREKCGLRGLKHGCQQGGCGACSVQVDGRLVTACLLPVARANGKSIETIEGLAQGEKLHPIQEAFVSCYATQCGFCTAGMIMATKALLESNPSPTREEVLVALSGNVCRCTGYLPIVDAVLAAARNARSLEPAVATSARLREAFVAAGSTTFSNQSGGRAEA